MKILQRCELRQGWMIHGTRVPDMTGKCFSCKICHSKLQIERPEDVFTASEERDGTIQIDLMCPICGWFTFIKITKEGEPVPRKRSFWERLLVFTK